MITEKEEIKNDLAKFSLSNYLEYKVFIESNGEDSVGNLRFEKEINYWEIIFLIEDSIKDSILRNGDNGFFATISLKENDVSIRILCECKIMDFFDIEKLPKFEPYLRLE